LAMSVLDEVIQKLAADFRAFEHVPLILMENGRGHIRGLATQALNSARSRRICDGYAPDGDEKVSGAAKGLTRESSYFTASSVFSAPFFISCPTSLVPFFMSCPTLCMPLSVSCAVLSMALS